MPRVRIRPGVMCALLLASGLFWLWIQLGPSCRRLDAPDVGRLMPRMETLLGDARLVISSMVGIAGGMLGMGLWRLRTARDAGFLNTPPAVSMRWRILGLVWLIELGLLIAWEGVRWAAAHPGG